MNAWKLFSVLLIVPIFLMGQCCGGRAMNIMELLTLCGAYLFVLTCLIVASRRKRLFVVDSVLIFTTAFLLLPWIQRTVRLMYY